MREARAMFLVRISIGQFMLEVKVGATSQRATTRTAPCSSCLAQVRGGTGEGGKGGNRGGTVRERRVIQAKKDTIPNGKNTIPLRRGFQAKIIPFKGSKPSLAGEEGSQNMPRRVHRCDR